MAIVNPRIGITENLPTGATYELLLITHPDGFPEGKIDFKLDDTPRKITGIQKVAQMFLKILLTGKGSDVVNVNLGTRFPEYAVYANRVQDDTEILASVTNEIRDAENQCRAILNTVGSDNASQLERVNILAIDTSKDSIIMYLRILTAAGITAQVAVPFPQLDMKLSEG